MGSGIVSEIEINNIKYEIIKDEREGFDLEELKNRFSEYFEPYTYIVGDWAYGKLRLKGFYDQKDKEVKPINNINFVDKYIKENCAYGCRYFIVKKVDKK